MPAYAKLDLALSRVTRPSPHTVLVYYAELNNALDRNNLLRYSYNADFTQRIPVRNLFNRSIFFGGSLTHVDF
jgi:hypothetical protein